VTGRVSPLRSIRRFCVYCFGGQAQLVPGCTAPSCPLFPWRSGKTGRVGREMPPDERASRMAALRKWRATKGEKSESQFLIC